MDTASQPLRLALFIALLLIALLVGILGAYLADGQEGPLPGTLIKTRERPEMGALF